MSESDTHNHSKIDAGAPTSRASLDESGERRTVKEDPASDSSITKGTPLLSDEQVAFYKARMASGFYRSEEVQKHISNRLTDAFSKDSSDD